MAFFDGDPYVGTVTSLRPPEEDDSPDIADDGVWFTVTFEDKTVEDYTYENILPLLIADDQKKYGLLSNKDWVIAKKMYKILSENLQSGSACARSPDFFLSERPNKLEQIICVSVLIFEANHFILIVPAVSLYMYDTLSTKFYQVFVTLWLFTII